MLSLRSTCSRETLMVLASAALGSLLPPHLSYSGTIKPNWFKLAQTKQCTLPKVIDLQIRTVLQTRVPNIGRHLSDSICTTVSTPVSRSKPMQPIANQLFILHHASEEQQIVFIGNCLVRDYKSQWWPVCK